MCSQRNPQIRGCRDSQLLKRYCCGRITGEPYRLRDLGSYDTQESEHYSYFASPIGSFLLLSLEVVSLAVCASFSGVLITLTIRASSLETALPNILPSRGLTARCACLWLRRVQSKGNWNAAPLLGRAEVWVSAVIRFCTDSQTCLCESSTPVQEADVISSSSFLKPLHLRVSESEQQTWKVMSSPHLPSLNSPGSSTSFGCTQFLVLNSFSYPITKCGFWVSLLTYMRSGWTGSK